MWESGISCNGFMHPMSSIASEYKLRINKKWGHREIPTVVQVHRIMCRLLSHLLMGKGILGVYTKQIHREVSEGEHSFKDCCYNVTFIFNDNLVFINVSIEKLKA